MSNEATKIKEQFGQLERRVLRGKGIDIGCGNAPIFPNVRCFDQQDGDANRISDYVKEQFDFVFSSHCLEHMLDPRAALKDWWSLVKEGGYLYVVVPDEDLYEQGVWPSKFNYEHKCTFTIFKEKSWSPVSVNVMDLIRELSDCYPVRIALQDNYYNYTLKGVDQTLGRALAQIQFVLRKGDPNERGASENDTGAGQRDPQLIKFFTEAMSRHTRGEWSAALLSYKRIQRQFPYFADAWTNGSMALFNLDRLDEALTAATTALVLAPESPSAHCALANALQGLGRTDEAAEHFEKAILLDPDHIPALTNLAVIHVHKGNFKEALDLENEALNINPYHSALWGNRGYTKMRMLDLGSAEDDLRVALELADNNQARWNLAYLQMIEGRYREAWPNFRASLYLDEWSANARDFGKPRWNGEDLNGGTLLVCTDSRFGDTLQFSRFLPRLKRFGGRVLLWTYQPLKRLLSDLSGIDGLVVEGEPLSDFDFVVPIMELPIILDADTADLTPLPPPLLTPTPPIPELDRPGFKIGLVWSDSPDNSNDALHSMDSAFLRELADIPGAERIAWYGLQKPRSPEPPPLRGFIDLSPHMSDFMDAARMATCLDLIVTVDASMAHLAGFLGLPAIVLLARFPDWRWGLGEATPWYPSLKLLRQPSHGDWKGAMEKLKTEIQRRMLLT